MAFGNMREFRGRRFAVICAAILVSGCAQSDLFSPYAAPGKYDFLDCPSIANQFKGQTAREQQLRELMSRAQEGSGGSIVNAVVYQDDFNTVRANIRQLRKAAEEKHCPADTVPPPQWNGIVAAAGKRPPTGKSSGMPTKLSNNWWAGASTPRLP